MNKRIKLLILNRAQFGYHIDTYYYCKYLRDSFDISYLGWDYEKPRVKLNRIKINYVSRKKGKIKRYINFVIKCIEYCRKHNGVVFIDYFPFCSVLRFFAKNNNYIVDIRTGYIIKNFILRSILNSLLSWEAKNFKNITIISTSLSKNLGLEKKDPKVIPLGANVISTECKSFKELKLLYVGTFHHRNLEQTIVGFAKYYKENKSKIRMNYIIIGAGYNQEEKLFEKLIKTEGLEDVISLVGSIKHENLKPYFDMQNIGVSYIPMTPYFECQPPTKTFEYMLSGMPVIATSTYENSLVVSDKNGVLIEDKSDSFYNGLKRIVSCNNYSSEEIRSTCKTYMWENIIQYELKNYLIKISE